MINDQSFGIYTGAITTRRSAHVHTISNSIETSDLDTYVLAGLVSLLTIFESGNSIRALQDEAFQQMDGKISQRNLRSEASCNSFQTTLHWTILHHLTLPRHGLVCHKRSKAPLKAFVSSVSLSEHSNVAW
jgi:hypothetical protein